MAAKAVVIPISNSWVWRRFQSIAEQRVAEGNCVAGERLWEVRTLPGIPETLRIQSTIDPADFQECSFRPDSGVITCTPGPAIQSPPLTFHAQQAASDLLRHEAGECTVDQAVSCILDTLVWVNSRFANGIEEPCC